MPYWKNGADILSGIERGGNANKQNLGGYKVAGAALSDIVTTTSGYLYSGETFTPIGYMRAGAQLVFQKAGCRPRVNSIWASGSAGTAYINRFADGEVWVAGSPNSRSGSKISNSIASMAYPRGIRYLIVALSGGGGGGARGSLAAGCYGGGSGAAATLLVRLPEVGSAKIVVGGGGAGSTTISTGGSNSGGTGDASSITLGSYVYACNGGPGGRYYYNDINAAATVTATTAGGDIVTLASSGGRNPASGAYPAGATGVVIGFGNPCPESEAAKGLTSSKGGNGGGSGYGNGSAGETGQVYLFY